jgi:2,3-bisphosphoglycerate-independent phosphoglycerate mutase
MVISVNIDYIYGIFHIKVSFLCNDRVVAMPTKCMLILLDGLGDRAYDEFENRTPLQTAKTPCLDRLAAKGANGLFHATLQGEALPSEAAHFAIFGYEPEYFPGRGPLEALGAGIDLGMNDVAVLSHFASFQKDGNALVLKNGKLSLGQADLTQLTHLLGGFGKGDIEIRFHPTHKAYGIVQLVGQVTPFFTDTDPVIHGMPMIEPLALAGYENDADTRNSAAALKNYLLHAYHALQEHPMNKARLQKGLDMVDGLVTQRAGRLKRVPTFERRYGLKGLSMASGLVYQGLSRFLGLDFVKVADSPDAGGDLAQRIKEAHRALADYDMVHVHTKVPDEAGHTKDPERKRAVIEALDVGMFQSIQPVLDDPDVLLVVTADHSTPSAGPLIHSGETVPILFRGRGVRQDHVRAYDEVAAAQGALGHVRGRELMLMILNALDRSKLQGLMDTPYNQPYWPGAYETLKVE